MDDRGRGEHPARSMHDADEARGATELPGEIEDLLADAFWREPERRSARLTELVAAHPEHAAALERRIAALRDLAARDRTGSDPAAGPVDEPGATLPPGTRVGPYRLLDVLGEGAFGVVYRAEQLLPVRRQVALKLLKRHDRRVLARFRQELDALSAMTHDHVARVLDAGEWHERPWIALELVEGSRSLTDYATECKLPLRDRLRLFRQVCDAVQHAHQRGVMHRDLKPGNVLVTEVDGVAVPKIIDFGVARAMTMPLDRRGQLTREDGLIGTPAYMSPEQARGSRDIDARTDVYSLGVLLFELLTGERPFDAQFAAAESQSDIVAIVQDAPPPRPSTVASRTATGSGTGVLTDQQQSRLRNLPPELDWVVLKAIAKNPDERYQTPRELGLDLERHLANEPLIAGPPTASYRFRKYVQRHRLEVAAGALILLSLVVGAAVAVRFGIRAEEARARAEETTGNLLEIANKALLDVHDDIAYRLGSTAISAKIAETVAASLEVAARWRIDDADYQRSVAWALFRVGRARADLGVRTGAMSALQQLEELCNRRVAAQPTSGNVGRLVEAIRWTAQSELSFGNIERAFETANRAYATARRFTDQHPDDQDAQYTLALCEFAKAQMLVANGDARAALADATRGMDRLGSFGASPDEPLSSRTLRSFALEVLASVNAASGRFADCTAALGELRELAKQEVHATSGDFFARLGLANALTDSVQTLLSFGPSAGLADLTDEAMDLCHDLVTEEPIDSRTNRAWTVANRLRGQLLVAEGHAAAALEPLEESCRSARYVAERAPLELFSRGELLTSLGALGDAQLQLQRVDDALVTFRSLTDAAEEAGRQFPRWEGFPREARRGQLLTCLTLYEAGHSEAARDLLAKTVSAGGTGDISTGSQELTLIARIDRESGHTDRALAAIRRARELELDRHKAVPDAIAPARALAILDMEEADVLLANDQVEDGQAAMKRGLELREASYERWPDDVRVGRDLCLALNKIAQIGIVKRQLDAARNLLGRSLPKADHLAKIAPDLPWSLDVFADTLSLQARLEALEGHDDESVELYTRCLQIRERVLELDADRVKGTAAVADVSAALARAAFGSNDRDAAIAHATHIVDRAEQLPPDALRRAAGGDSRIDILERGIHLARAVGRRLRDPALEIRARKLSEAILSARSDLNPGQWKPLGDALGATYDVARLENGAGRYAEAAATAERGCARLAGLTPDSDHELERYRLLSMFYRELGRARRELGQLDRARQVFENLVANDGFLLVHEPDPARVREASALDRYLARPDALRPRSLRRRGAASPAGDCAPRGSCLRPARGRPDARANRPVSHHPRACTRRDRGHHRRPGPGCAAPRRRRERRAVGAGCDRERRDPHQIAGLARRRPDPRRDRAPDRQVAASIDPVSVAPTPSPTLPASPPA